MIALSYISIAMHYIYDIIEVQIGMTNHDKKISAYEPPDERFHHDFRSS